MSEREPRPRRDEPSRPTRTTGSGAGGSRGSERRGGPPGAGGHGAARGGGPSGGGRPRTDEREGSARPSTRSVKPRRQEPPLPEEVTGHELDRAARAELASLASINADIVARHLVMAGRLLDDDPETAYQHAAAAASRAGRVGAVREAAGLAAYRSGRYAEALSELRAARRITGDNSFLPVMADAERGLGRPERALEMASSPEASSLDAGARVELLIVTSGARRDLGQLDAAVLALQGPALQPTLRRPWSARLFYAYADALLAAGRRAEAVTWFEHAADADGTDETDADMRLAELAGVTFLTEDDDYDDEPEGPEAR